MRCSTTRSDPRCGKFKVITIIDEIVERAYTVWLRLRYTFEIKGFGIILHFWTKVIKFFVNRRRTFCTLESFTAFECWLLTSLKNWRSFLLDALECKNSKKGHAATLSRLTFACAAPMPAMYISSIRFKIGWYSWIFSNNQNFGKRPFPGLNLATKPVKKVYVWIRMPTTHFMSQQIVI